MNDSKKLFKKTGIALLISFLSSGVFAANIADEQIFGTNLSFSPSISYTTATLSFSNDSDNSNIVSSFSSGEQISIDLSSQADGLYHYQLAMMIGQKAEGSAQTIVKQSGQFRIINGDASIYNDTVANIEATLKNKEQQEDLTEKISLLSQNNKDAQ